MNKPKRPNIILITTDQQRFDTLGKWKPKWLRTPHLDVLAAQGVTFENAYADCPLCVPARVGIMTGKFVHNHGMFGNGFSSDVIGRENTLPAYLRSLGYQTAAIGKMHFGPMRARHGFDEMILPQDYYNEMRNAGHDLQPMRNGLGQNELCPGVSTVPEAMTHTAWVAEKCREYIQERRDPTAPYFLWCSFSKPHPPFDPPEPYYSMYRDCPIPPAVRGDWCENSTIPLAFQRQIEKSGANLYSDEILREAKAAYYGMITHIDYCIGRVLAAAQETEESRNLNEILIIFTSDHGEYLGDHGATGKIFHHESSSHIPFIYKAPGSWKSGLYGISDPSLVNHADIVPTVVRAAGGDIPDGLDGVDLHALVRKEIPPRRHLAMLSGEKADTPRANVSITDGVWKYLWFPEGGSEQLFNLENDRYETIDLSGNPKYRNKLKELRTELVRLHQQLPLQFVENNQLKTMPEIDDRINGKRELHPWTPGYTTEYVQYDIKH